MAYSKEALSHASEVLGIDSTAKTDEIIEKTKKLSEMHAQEQTAESFEKLIEIHKASELLLEESRSTTSQEETSTSKRKSSFFEPGDRKTNNQNKHQLKKKRKKLAFIALGVLLVLSAIALPIGLSRLRANQYSTLESQMLNFEKLNMEEIGETINSLPRDYKDVSSIDKQYEEIMREVLMIENNAVNIDSERMRTAYYNLESIDESTSDWDLSEYLNSRSNKIKLYDITWTNDDYFFYYRPSTQNPKGSRLTSDLPSKVEEGKDYVYTVEDNHTFFEYENVNDFTESFDAYKIVSIEEDAITVLCYSNDETYTLYAD